MRRFEVEIRNFESWQQRRLAALIRQALIVELTYRENAQQLFWNKQRWYHYLKLMLVGSQNERFQQSILGTVHRARRRRMSHLRPCFLQYSPQEGPRKVGESHLGGI